jgi:hypothetical protein
MFFFGDVGQQSDVEDIESDLARMRSRLKDQAKTDQSQDQALVTLRRELNDTKLLLAEVVKLLIAGGTLDSESVERLVAALDAVPGGGSKPV